METIDNFTAFILGCVQGLTEYLPISSSGHLVIVQNLFGITEPEIFFDIVLHIGTLIAVLGYYRKDIVEAITGTVAGALALKNGAKWSDVNKRYEGFRLTFLIGAGTIPTGLIGVTFKDDFELMFGSARMVGIMLLITGVMLMLTLFTKEKGRGVTQIRWWEAVLIGIAQGLAITPGISRSGATICVALFMGIGRETAAKYSFLLSVPSIVGALILKWEPGGSNVALTSLGIGFISSLIMGYLCLALLVMLLKKGKLPFFSIYCFAVGAGVIFYFG